MWLPQCFQSFSREKLGFNVRTLVPLHSLDPWFHNGFLPVLCSGLQIQLCYLLAERTAICLSNRIIQLQSKRIGDGYVGIESLSLSPPPHIPTSVLAPNSPPKQNSVVLHPQTCSLGLLLLPW